MEGNRDEAEKCVEIAREALNAGNREKAQRFLQKAEKLYPLPSARGEALGPLLPRPVPGPPRNPPPPHHRPSGSRRAPRPRPPGPPDGPPRHTPAPALTDPAGPAVDHPRLPPRQLACEMPALSRQARVAGSLVGFRKCPAVILPGDSSGPVLAEWGFISGCVGVWSPPSSS